MNATQAIEALEKQIIDAINGCHLHPAIIRLVLVNITHQILDEERKAAQQPQKDGDANA